MDGVRRYSYGMGRGKALRIQLSRRDRQQLDELLSGGLQPVRTVLRALALRQMDTGQATPAVAVSLGLSAKAVWQIGKRYQQGGFERALYDASRPELPPAGRRHITRAPDRPVDSVCRSATPLWPKVPD